MTRKDSAAKILPIILFVIILTVGYRQKDTLYHLLKNVRGNWLLAGLFLYFCNYMTRAWRLQFLAESVQFPFFIGLKTSSLHGYYSYFLPFRSGDISLPFLLKRLTALPLLSGGSVLVRARLLDIFSLGILLSCSSVLSFKKLDGKVFLFFLLASVVLLGAPLLINLAIARGRAVRTLWIKSFAKGVTQRPMSWKEISLSLLVWFWTGCTLFSATQALSIPIQFMDIWLLVAIQLPLQLVPIQGVANTGNHEVGWVVGFALLGISPEKGLDFAMASHVIIIFYVLMLGLMGFLIPEKGAQSSIRS